MGKYMRKSKTASEVALLDVSHTQSSHGVRTRAKTLALQRLQRSTAAASAGCGDCGSYMQLRSRRLQKPPIGSQPRRHKPPAPKDSNPSPKADQNQNKSSRASSKLRQVSPANSRSVNKGDECLDDEKKEDNILQESNVGGVEKTENNVNVNNGDDFAVEGSFGENLPDFEGRERTTRETTPISLIRDPDAIPTPGSSTRRTGTNQAHTRIQNALEIHIPTTQEMNEFFSGSEEQQQREFMEKYNYDPVNDRPLPGRFEWQKIDP